MTITKNWLSFIIEIGAGSLGKCLLRGLCEWKAVGFFKRTQCICFPFSVLMSITFTWEMITYLDKFRQYNCRIFRQLPPPHCRSAWIIVANFCMLKCTLTYICILAVFTSTFSLHYHGYSDCVQLQLTFRDRIIWVSFIITTGAIPGQVQPLRTYMNDSCFSLICTFLFLLLSLQVSFSLIQELIRVHFNYTYLER